MNKTKVKRYLVLGILFFLPVTFLLMLLPAKHNYNPLEIINQNVSELKGFSSDTDENVSLKNHITVLAFLGNQPMSNAIAASNLKELVYDKFKGFKRFQIVVVVPKGTEKEVELLKKEINSYEDLKFWHFIFGDENNIQAVYSSLESESPLKEDLSTNQVFIIDNELNQRGRTDDRSDNELAMKSPVYGLNSYNCIEVAEIKNKMSEDMRVLFTEYREKRKGNFDSSTRRANDLKGDNEQQD
ncbi:MAG: hypothetical protein KDD03_01625 [Gelidibacter sp.]|nr:hypothetical protein [Gelidibacter sp.]